MMSVKRSTQTFSKSEQTPSTHGDQATVNVNSGADFQKAFGEQDLGTVLNKVVDPNFVDPSKKVRGTGNKEMGKDAFMKLMLAQMKNQDPTNPTPSHEMAAQLAQFTSLEQLTNINTTLEGMRDSQAPNSNYQALAFIGKKVSGDSSKLTRAAGDTKHDFNFELMNDAGKTTVTIKDSAGNPVRKYDMIGLKKGPNSLEWNGLDEAGSPARAGEYKFVVEATAQNGQKVYSKTSFEGRITGLNYAKDGPVLMVGDQTIKMSDVKKIEDVGPETGASAIPLGAGGKQNPLAAMQAAPLKPGSRTVVKPQEKQPTHSPATTKQEAIKADMNSEDIPPAPEEEQAMKGNIEDVPMSRELLNKLGQGKT
jgi:flagellar basal-body rod modification protein FlgD